MDKQSDNTLEAGLKCKSGSERS